MVVTGGLCFGAQRIFRVDENHNLEVPSRDCRRFLGVDGPSEPPPSAGFRLLAHASCLLSAFPLGRLFAGKLLQSFLMILGPTGFLHERIAIKQQSRSSVV